MGKLAVDVVQMGVGYNMDSRQGREISKRYEIILSITISVIVALLEFEQNSIFACVLQ